MAHDGAELDDGPKALVYFGHSYRPDDREVNTFFWQLFHAAGLFFTVDPESRDLSIPYLESMMAISNCFVAVVPRREGAPGACSPYIRFEFGLAVQARKPWLVFVEQGIDSDDLPTDAGRVIAFNRERLAADRRRFTDAIAAVAAEVHGARNPDVRLRQPCGLLTGGPASADIYNPEVIEALRGALRKAGRSLRVIDAEWPTTFHFCQALDRVDVLILEVDARLQAPWLAGYVMGRAIPSIKVCHRRPGETPTPEALPPLVAAHRPEHTEEDAASFWYGAEDLVAQVLPHLARFNTRRKEFHTLEEGEAYFARAGRRRDQVFVSNAGGVNVMAQPLIARLRRESIDFFHYQVKDALPIGERWQAELEREIRESGIFIALLSAEYLRSPWCLYELEVALPLVAAGRLCIHPYALEDAVLPALAALGLSPLQVRLSSDDDASSLVAKIVENLDRELKKPARVADRPADAEPATAVPDVRAVLARFALPPVESGTGAGGGAVAGGVIKPEPVLSDDERGRLVGVLAERLTAADASSRAGLVQAMLVYAGLHTALAGESYLGSADEIAAKLVLGCERLGVLPGRGPAVAQLATALRDRDLVRHDAKAFLSVLVQRLVQE